MANNNENKVLNVPHLRFPEFTEEWVNVSLKDVADFQKERISSGLLDESTYISTENILQNFQGVQSAISIPANTNVVAYKKNDILLSNIRPYLKKAWFSDRIGGCSADVFVLRSKTCEPEFLYNVIASDKFINYVMSGAKGVKMPRGDKNQMESFSFSIPAVVEQRKISRLFQLLDERIVTQNKIIKKYESLIKGISNLLLYETEGKSVCLGDILIERSERTQTNNQYDVLSSTVKGIFSQREYFSKDIASENNVGYKIIRLHDIVLSPQNLWMGNINYNDKFDIGIVSPSYKIFSIGEGYDKRFVAAMLKTHRALYNYILVSEQGASIVRRNLNMEAFSQLVFKLPTFDKQRKIGYAISSLKSQLEAANKIVRAYISQKQYLLRQMFI
ncbi:restriction endonuclease subunit S [Bacteroides stercoris]|uniref:restriction endonuclease subunit S n=1 Tax=Bacteroides stercoris TaxID=46506 RepID=UPI00234C3868|nr:restriction endonuclease subunit S [Bacteroides stercoris]MDC7169297.1 restriction endonuclease subunit S [Bacteroides stercoris]